MRLIIRGLKKKFGKTMILDDIGYSFEEGIVYALVGGKESGKTTFFQCISNEIPYEQGTILLEYDNQYWKPDINSVGISFQTPMLPEFLTVYEYIRYFLDMHKKGIASEYSEEDYMKLVDLSETDQNTLIKDCSPDVKNKLQLIGILIAGCPVILLDEPCSKRSKSEWERFAALLKVYKRHHIIIMATDNPEAAEAVCDEFLILKNGTIRSADAEEIKAVCSPEEELRNVD